MLIAVRGLYVLMLALTIAVMGIAWNDRIPRAIIGMGCGVVALWITLCGGLMWRYRQPLAAWIRALPMSTSAKFFSACVTLALLEEAVTTTMTNLAPLFGVEAGQAYITASPNYLDVIAFHSVVILVPMFAAWTWLVSRWRFTAAEVFFLFGVVGVYAEKHLAEFPFWIFVYGLMVWLPAYALPARPSLPRPRWWALLMALVLPVAAAAPVVMLLLWSSHPLVHFPPVQGLP